MKRWIPDLPRPKLAGALPLQSMITVSLVTAFARSVRNDQRKMLSPKIRDFAQRILAYEAGLSGASEANGSAAFRASEKLRRPLSALIGVAGFHSLLTRALMLAKREARILSAVQVNPDGSLEGLGELPTNEADGAGLMLIVQLLGLLEAFIGEYLTLSLVHDVWRDLPFNDKILVKQEST